MYNEMIIWFHFNTFIWYIQPPRFKELQQVLKTKLREASAAGSSASKKLLDAFVDSIFTFSHQSLRPTEVGQASMIAYTLHKMQQQFIALNFL